jgi:hypothetical protein
LERKSANPSFLFLPFSSNPEGPPAISVLHCWFNWGGLLTDNPHGRHSGTVTNERATTSVQVEITDISGNEGVFMLDTDGFQLVRLQSVEKEFVDENVLKRVYYLEVEQLLKDM